VDGPEDGAGEAAVAAALLVWSRFEDEDLGAGLVGGEGRDERCVPSPHDDDVNFSWTTPTLHWLRSLARCQLKRRSCAVGYGGVL
jgi:hypothetical protein